MRLDAASAVTTLPSPPQKKNKNNNNNNNTTTTTTNTAIRTCSRSRSQTDPSARHHHHHHHPPGPFVRDRRSVDFASPTHRHKPASLQFNPASPLSSESFSNPALASFSPRKVAALKSGARAGVVSSSSTSTSNTTTTSSSFFFSTSNTASSSFFSSSSSIPKLLLQTPRAARDLDLQSQSSSAAHFNSPLSPGTLPSAASSTVSPSESLRPPSTIDSRTSYQKRAPASRSSLGIETASGPPPALSTQRSLAQERHTTLSSSLEYPDRSRSFGLASSSSSTRDSGSKLNSSSASTSVDVGMRPEQSPTSILKRSSLPTRTVYSSYQSDRPRSTLASQANESPNDGDNDDGDDDDDDLTARLDTNADASSKDSDDSRQKNEDVFLNIAKSSSSRRDSARGSERQRSKFGLTGLSSRLRTKEDTPPPDRNLYDSQDVSPLNGHTTGIPRSAASSHPLDDSSRLKYLGSTARSTIGLPRSRFGRSTTRELSPEPPQQRPSERRGSAQDTFQLRAHRQSNIPGGRGYRALSNSDGTDPAKLDVERSRYDGTESTLSTTAPSTVWDELDDLKSRIRKLELTGKLPTSSAAAMSSVSGERPRTATTTVTTISSSPKHGRRTSASPNNSGDAATADAQMQTLLRTGLTKVKPAVSPEIYSALEATANDALTLSSMFGSNAQQLASTMSVVGTATGSDRQFKRKVDSMCRSLTELCIALADQKLIAASKNRPGSRDATSSVPQVNGADTTPNTTTTTNFRRSASHEPEDVGRQAGSLGRTLTSSRLEGRRSSMLNLSTTGSTVRSSQEASDSQVTLKPSTPVSRIGRSSTTATLRNRRQDEEDTHDKSSIVSRTLSSRVFTDIPEPKPRHSLIHRSSREFSPSHDQQTHQDQQLPPQRTIQVRNTPSNQSGIPLRRTFLSTGSHLSTTSHLNIQPGYRRYGSSVINTGLTHQAERGGGGGGGAAGAGAPDQGETVSSPLTATATTPTTRTASHFSSMQQLRPRTNSFGTRRLSLRRTLDGGSVANAG
uniref:LPXTG-motif cell wall anchor domain-containing protein n=1 Tax=Coccidioides posadasii RMSCC 3488 TaxID=454284 RepID=A0A0J6HZQ9_COCPO|nr:hypothetical protein CPAG_00829 [Coccidioides posadasii RMSCC 3488]